MGVSARTRRTIQRTREEMCARFIDELRKRGNVTDACRVAGFERRSTAYEWRNADPEFAAQWEEALDEASDLLEKEAWRRAVDGVQEPVIGRVGKDEDGILTGPDGKPLYIRKYSDTLMALLLKAHKPEKYRERQDITANVNANVKGYVGISPDDWDSSQPAADAEK